MVYYRLFIKTEVILPKKNADFPARLDLFVKKETRLKVIAIAYQMGLKGVYAKSGRALLEKAIEEYIDDLSPRDKADFDKILNSVMISEGDLP